MATARERTARLKARRDAGINETEGWLDVIAGRKPKNAAKVRAAYARAASLTPKRRQDVARKAAQARWGSGPRKAVKLVPGRFYQDRQGNVWCCVKVYPGLHRGALAATCVRLFDCEGRLYRLSGLYREEQARQDPRDLVRALSAKKAQTLHFERHP